ncbi:hypothetical protein [Streptomyces acidicola]|uniref:hypothetical protein n=1 Tax=Streptomyces acidicola TaxID=2596892 RepID=UPI00343C1A9B
MTYDTEGGSVTRLLPWVGPEGKPCYVVTDGAGYVSRMADTVERLQLGMAEGLLDHAAHILADRRATSAQLRFLLARMAESLADVHRIAESRGARLPVPVHRDPDVASFEAALD